MKYSLIKAFYKSRYLTLGLLHELTFLSQLIEKLELIHLIEESVHNRKSCNIGSDLLMFSLSCTQNRKCSREYRFLARIGDSRLIYVQGFHPHSGNQNE